MSDLHTNAIIRLSHYICNNRSRITKRFRSLLESKAELHLKKALIIFYENKRITALGL